MLDFKPRKLFQFMGAPMTEIQGPGRTKFKRIGTSNMLQVKRCAMVYQVTHRLHITRMELNSMVSYPLKKSGVLDQRHFYGLRNPSHPLAVRRGGQKQFIVKHRYRRTD